jgi:cation diffusion facilitator family transporter
VEISSLFPCTEAGPDKVGVNRSQALAQGTLEGYAEGQRIAKLSVLMLIGVGVMEIGVGSFTGSLSLTADGIDSFSDSVISLIVWFGLRLSLKEPSKYFQYGYFKVESLVAFCTSIGMIGVASFILYRSYLSLLSPHKISFPAYALISLLVAGSVSLYFAIRMRKVAKKHGLVSLQISAANSIKDASASFVVLASVALSAVGISWMDAVGALIVSLYIYSVAYVAARESGLVLLDSFNSPEVVERVRSTVQLVPEVRKVTEIKLRRNGQFISGRVRIAVAPEMQVLEATEITKQVESALPKEIPSLREFVVVLVPYTEIAA